MVNTNRVIACISPTCLYAVIDRSMAIHDIIEELPIFDCGTIERAFVSNSNVMIRTTPSNMLR
jgi:hypothetical protein